MRTFIIAIIILATIKTMTLAFSEADMTCDLSDQTEVVGKIFFGIIFQLGIIIWGLSVLFPE